MASIWRVNNSTVLGGEVCAPWTTGHAYSVGARVVCRIAYGTVARRAYVYECTTGGTSHATTEPTWPTSGTVDDNDVVWTRRSPNDGNWDNASCYLFYVINHAAVAAGDFIYIDDGHSEALNYGALTYPLTGSATMNNPIKVICVNKADDSLSSGAIVRSTSTLYAIALNGSFYSYGVNYQSAIAVGVGTIAAVGSTILEGDKTNTLITVDTTAGGNLSLGSANVSNAWGLIIKNGNINFTLVGGYIHIYGRMNFLWKCGSVLNSLTSGITNLFKCSSATGMGGAIVRIEDVDLSAVGKAGVATSLVGVSNFTGDILFTRCKLPSAANFTVISGTWAAGGCGKVRLHHCSSANAYYDFYEESYEGSVQDETTIVRTGGASDGTTSQAWKMISSANTRDNYRALESPPITIWNSSTTEKTFTIECIWDSATNIQDDEIWMELEYPVNNTDGLGAVANDKCAILGTPADKSAGVGSGGWTTTGLTNPNSFKCSVTVTPGKVGPITARIYLAKASTTIYVDPKITVS